MSESHDSDPQNLKTRLLLFETALAKDQKSYYKSKSEIYRNAQQQILWFRLLAAFTASVVSFFTAYLSNLPRTGVLTTVLVASSLISVIAPAVAALFQTYADIFQWDRLIHIYSDAANKLDAADKISREIDLAALVPNADGAENPALTKRHARVNRYISAVLGVMRAEANQWGQSVHAPASLEEFEARAKQRAEQLKKEDKTEP